MGLDRGVAGGVPHEPVRSPRPGRGRLGSARSWGQPAGRDDRLSRLSKSVQLRRTLLPSLGRFVLSGVVRSARPARGHQARGFDGRHHVLVSGATAGTDLRLLARSDPAVAPDSVGPARLRYRGRLFLEVPRSATIKDPRRCFLRSGPVGDRRRGAGPPADRVLRLALGGGDPLPTGLVERILGAGRPSGGFPPPGPWPPGTTVAGLTRPVWPPSALAAPACEAVGPPRN